MSIEWKQPKDVLSSLVAHKFPSQTPLNPFDFRKRIQTTALTQPVGSVKKPKTSSTTNGSVQREVTWYRGQVYKDGTHQSNPKEEGQWSQNHEKERA